MSEWRMLPGYPVVDLRPINKYRVMMFGPPAREYYQLLDERERAIRWTWIPFRPLAWLISRAALLWLWLFRRKAMAHFVPAAHGHGYLPLRCRVRSWPYSDGFPSNLAEWIWPYLIPKQRMDRVSELLNLRNNPSYPWFFSCDELPTDRAEWNDYIIRKTRETENKEIQ